ncbi:MULTISPECIES: response regulator transcription factor [unclassified Lysinibacillus]|uniref:response regulator transcription factor n=1 Tax=unclassified Lysinibacillus TaxID=2636778 RepID=UPI002554DD3E|nr:MULTISPECIES: response regulator transcription factor [unclassified Lysinibacillus]MDM5247271.1 response regulator transcription factor [Lysinibacillus sp. G4S2]
MKRTILIIEDEVKIANIIADYFTMNEYRILIATDGKVGLQMFEEETVDLIILDIMLPEIDGFSVCRRIRKKSDIPIIMLTARSEVEDQLMGYEFKVDDYMTKPFNPEILVAKSKVLLDRIYTVKKEDRDKETLTLKGVTINKLTREVWIDSTSIELEPKQFDLLLYLMENKHIVLSRDQILNEVWGYDYFGSARVVDAQVKKLRKNLQHKAYLIKTVFGLGYKFEVE